MEDFWIILVLIWFFGWGSDWFGRSSEQTVYFLDCASDARGRCTTQTALAPLTFKVYPEQQFVVFWIDGFTPDKYTNCSIADKKNWVCRPNGEAPNAVFYQMIDGEYLSPNSPFASVSDKQVSRYRWWLTKLANMAGAKHI